MSESLAPESERLPVDTVAFWRRRVMETFATGGMLHQCIWNDQYELWQFAQDETAGILQRVIPAQVYPRKTRVLDAGCGYGALLDCFTQARTGGGGRLLDCVEYVGVDVSPDLIELARYRYPTRDFLCCDLSRPGVLPYDAGHFDFAVVRSVREMLQRNVGDPVWQRVRAEVGRVSRKLLIIGYPEAIGQTPEYWVEEP